MAWDSRVMGLMSAVWLVMAILWATAIPMPEGSRVWGFGALLMFLVFIATALLDRGSGGGGDR